jgi:hypothetical protein
LKVTFALIMIEKTSFTEDLYPYMHACWNSDRSKAVFSMKNIPLCSASFLLLSGVDYKENHIKIEIGRNKELTEVHVLLNQNN